MFYMMLYISYGKREIKHHKNSGVNKKKLHMRDLGLSKAGFYVTDITQINKSAVYITVRRNVKM